jgi:hypothetical protein
VLGGLDLAEESAEIRLRRKPSERDLIVFNIRRDDAQLVAEVHHPGDSEAEGLPSELDSKALGELDRLWQLLRAGIAGLLSRKERLTSLALDGEDPSDSDKVVPFVEIVVKLIAPTVAEISKRSPSAAELSLKAEDDAGRREEFYVKKADLLANLEALGAPERKIFDALAIHPPNGEKPVEKKGRESLPDDAAWENPQT